MSLFFEDLEIKEQTPVFVEDTSGLLSVTLESEMAWHNLETTMMKEEFKAVLQEDEKKLEGGKTNFFKTIIKFFETVWNAIVTGIRNLIAKFTIQLRNGEKFLKGREAQLSAYKGGKSAEMYEWHIESLIGISKAFPAGIGTKLKGFVGTNSTSAMTADDIAKELGYSSFKDLDSEIVSKARSAERKSVAIDTNAVALAKTDMTSAKTVITTLNELAKGARDLVGEGKKQAQEGLRATQGSKESLQKLKAAGATTAKNATSVLNKIINVFTKLAFERYADATKTIRAVVSGAKADDKAVAQGKKLIEKQKKADAKKVDTIGGKPVKKADAKVESALFGLTLEDFEDEDEFEDLEEDFDLDFDLED
jgi:hypothetical protein